MHRPVVVHRRGEAYVQTLGRARLQRSLQTAADRCWFVALTGGCGYV